MSDLEILLIWLMILWGAVLIGLVLGISLIEYINAEIISQIMIFVGCLAIFMVSLPDNSKAHKWGYVVGLASQPLWFYTAIYHKQLSIFCVSVVFTVSCVIGVLVRF